jgi:hypothetical protein
MSHRGIRLCLFAVTACMTASLSGCGGGLLGEDDVLPGACALGPTPPFQPPALSSKDSAGRLKIYLLRGLGNIYSLGLDRLAEEMRQLDLSPTMVDWPTWENTAQQIVSEYRGPVDADQYIFIGHSFGADDAIRIAWYLRDYGIPVQLLLLLDATAPGTVPDNVVTCIHYYEPWLPGDLFPDIFSGNPVVAEAGNSRTQLSNLLFTHDALGDGVGCADHFSIDANQLMHNLILTEVFQLMAVDAESTGGRPARSSPVAFR